MVGLGMAPGRLKSLAANWFSRQNIRAVAEWLREPVLVFAGVYLIAALVVQPFYVPSGSMQPTLGIGDLLIATKFSYGYDRYSLPFFSGPTPKGRLFGRLPQRGDVVVFRKPGNPAVALVKRVIGLPGDRIQMKSGRVWINGRAVVLDAVGTGRVEDGPGETAPGSYFDADRYIETLPNGRKHPIFKKFVSAEYDDTGEYVVPPGNLFVMGDNRDDSADSRISPDFGGVGFLPATNVMGRAQLVLVSVDFVNARGIWQWPFRVRWDRTFNRIR